MMAVDFLTVTVEYFNTANTQETETRGEKTREKGPFRTAPPHKQLAYNAQPPALLDLDPRQPAGREVLVSNRMFR
ncbi:hypothetical protein RRG08_004854 [Elysia crispata]|uniref:Uncharacterized protein n=1 Tax=Elysia crispata TaxID=231223 RepID=A0AAE1D9X2_9GAST|nr:hypothetical protein RRG08_004854 [Elysia crispata]